MPELAKVLVEKEVAAVAYETIELPDGSLPLLRPMSEVAGKMAPQVGAKSLEKEGAAATASADEQVAALDSIGARNVRYV